MSTVETPMSPGEHAKFAAYEKVLTKRPGYLRKRADVFRAIYDKKLYRGTWGTHGPLDGFCHYLHHRWWTTYAYVERLWYLANLVRQLPAEYGRLVVNETQARELAKIPAEERVGILKTIVGRGQPITARAIRQAAHMAQVYPEKRITQREMVSWVYRADPCDRFQLLRLMLALPGVVPNKQILGAMINQWFATYVRETRGS